MPEAPVRKPSWPTLVAIAGLLALFLLQSLVQRAEVPRAVPYSALLQLIQEGRVQKAEIDANEIRAELKPKAKGDKPENVRTERIPGSTWISVVISRPRLSGSRWFLAGFCRSR
jgi:ATP-dependent Zn protease